MADILAFLGRQPQNRPVPKQFAPAVATGPWPSVGNPGLKRVAHLPSPKASAWASSQVAATSGMISKAICTGFGSTPELMDSAPRRK